VKSRINRILHIQKVAGIAGSENHLLTLLPQLKDYGYETAMLVLADRHDRPSCFIERMQAAGVPTRVLRMAGDFDPLVVPRLVRLIRRGGYDLVHTHLLHADIYGRLAARIAGSKIVSTYHCDDPFHLIRGVKLADRITASMCSQIICISEAVFRFVKENLKISSTPLNVIHYGFKLPDPTEISTDLRFNLGITKDCLIIGVVARLTGQKGHIYLFQALQILSEFRPPIHLVVVGDGELKDNLMTLATQLGIRTRVHFLGFRTDVASLIHAFDIFVLPSLYEGFGLVLLEAMAASKPIVATGVSAIPEIVLDGETGLLVPPRDAESLAQAIMKLVIDPNLASSLGHAGYKRLKEQFTVEKMVKDTVDVYRKIMNS
jgi:glycosyltransferase involved in cell wall biosynthesis